VRGADDDLAAPALAPTQPVLPLPPLRGAAVGAQPDVGARTPGGRRSGTAPLVSGWQIVAPAAATRAATSASDQRARRNSSAAGLSAGGAARRAARPSASRRREGGNGTRTAPRRSPRVARDSRRRSRSPAVSPAPGGQDRPCVGPRWAVTAKRTPGGTTAARPASGAGARRRETVALISHAVSARPGRRRLSAAGAPAARARRRRGARRRRSCGAPARPAPPR